MCRAVYSHGHVVRVHSLVKDALRRTKDPQVIREVYQPSHVRFAGEFAGTVHVLVLFLQDSMRKDRRLCYQLQLGHMSSAACDDFFVHVLSVACFCVVYTNRCCIQCSDCIGQLWLKIGLQAR